MNIKLMTNKQLIRWFKADLKNVDVHDLSRVILGNARDEECALKICRAVDLYINQNYIIKKPRHAHDR